MKDEVLDLTLLWDKEHEMYQIQYDHGFISESTLSMPANLMPRLTQIIEQIIKDHHSSEKVMK